MKKILIVRRYSGYGGIERQIEQIAFGLKKAGYSVLLISDKESPLTRTLTSGGIEVQVLAFDGIIKTAYKIRKICQLRNITVIQSHMLWESFLCRAVKLMYPRVLNVFRVHTYIDCSHISNTKKNAYHIVSKITDCLVNYYASINYFNIKELKERTHISQKKIFLVHDAVRLLLTEETVFVPPNGHIAMIANFVNFKGHDVLLQSMKILKDKGYKIIAHLYGGVPGAGTNFENTIILDKIKKNIVEYDLCNEVIIEGFSEDIKTSLNNVGIVVLPSYAEGTPNVLLEGMLLKKIVIASDVGGIPEFITDNKTGFLHRSGAAEELASIIIKVHNAPQILLEKMALEAENLVKLEYNSNQLIEGLISIYKKHEERQ